MKTWKNPMAKNLCLVRHAKSSWADMNLRNFDRPLNQRSLRDAPEMGKRLKGMDVRPDMVLCSPTDGFRLSKAEK